MARSSAVTDAELHSFFVAVVTVLHHRGGRFDSRKDNPLCALLVPVPSKSLHSFLASLAPLHFAPFAHQGSFHGSLYILPRCPSRIPL
eukprot:1161187-Pelagomonas_calceolata.AAC.6